MKSLQLLFCPGNVLTAYCYRLVKHDIKIVLCFLRPDLSKFEHLND